MNREHEALRLVQMIDSLRKRYKATGTQGYTETVIEIVMEGNVIIELTHHHGARSHESGLVIEDWAAARKTSAPLTVVFPEKVCAIKAREAYFPFEKNDE